jgi:hypothetical protein
MSTARLMAAAFLALVASVAFGRQEKTQGPPTDKVPLSPPPTIVTVKEVRADRADLVCEQILTERVPATITKVVEEKGVKKEVPVTTFVTKAVPTLVTFPLKESTFITPAGKKLTAEEAAKRLTAGTLLFVSVGGKPDPAYLKILRDDALILVTPAWGTPVDPKPVPRPPER